jgi:hypothetical protein
MIHSLDADDLTNWVWGHVPAGIAESEYGRPITQQEWDEMVSSLLTDAENFGGRQAIADYPGFDDLYASLARVGLQAPAELTKLVEYLTSFGVYEEELDRDRHQYEKEVKKAIHSIRQGQSRVFQVRELRGRWFLLVAPYEGQSRVFQAVRVYGTVHAEGELVKTEGGGIAERFTRAGVAAVTGAGGSGTLTVRCNADHFTAWVQPLLDQLTTKQIQLA